MKCQGHEKLMTDLLAGEIAGEDRKSLESHLAQCPSCAKTFEEMRKTWDLMSDSLRHERLEPCKAELKEFRNIAQAGTSAPEGQKQIRIVKTINFNVSFNPGIFLKIAAILVFCGVITAIFLLPTIRKTEKSELLLKEQDASELTELQSEGARMPEAASEVSAGGAADRANAPGEPAIGGEPSLGASADKAAKISEKENADEAPQSPQIDPQKRNKEKLREWSSPKAKSPPAPAASPHLMEQESEIREPGDGKMAGEKAKDSDSLLVAQDKGGGESLTAQAEENAMEIEGGFGNARGGSSRKADLKEAKREEAKLDDSGEAIITRAYELDLKGLKLTDEKSLRDFISRREPALAGIEIVKIDVPGGNLILRGAASLLAKADRLFEELRREQGAGTPK